jgi:hypothetical protein
MGSPVIVAKEIINPATLEAMSCNEDLALAEDLNLQRIRIASDSMELIKNIEGSFCPYSIILREIEIRKNKFYLVSFVHEGRSTNQDAHNLVRSALSLYYGRRVWLLQPWNDAMNKGHVYAKKTWVFFHGFSFFSLVASLVL